MERNIQADLAAKRKVLAEYGSAMTPQKVAELTAEIAALESLVGASAPATTSTPARAATIAPPQVSAQIPAIIQEAEDEELIDTEVAALIEDGWYTATVLGGDSLAMVHASTSTRGFQVVFKLDTGQTLVQTFFDQKEPADVNPILKRLFDVAGLVDPATKRFRGRITDLAGVRVDIRVITQHDTGGEYPPKNRVSGFRKVRKEVL